MPMLMPMPTALTVMTPKKKNQTTEKMYPLRLRNGLRTPTPTPTPTMPTMPTPTALTVMTPKNQN